ncbi:MAG TPA: peptidylprolyl isomerase, partial [Arenicellales bacterium]|nr:peptidylprolyl isomerase [Arenicellales bacterium]
MVKMTTSLGELTIELYPEQAPETVDNFLQYTDDGFYDGTVFHRVIPGFVLQGGGFTPGMERKPTREPISNESDNGLKNERGTLSMARLPDPHSATSQFFINLVDNPHLDHQGGRQWGYAVFGKVVDGLDAVDRIGAVETTSRAGMGDVPEEPVIIEEAK